MKEFIFNIKKELAAGIAPEDIALTSASFMSDCYNYRPTPFGVSTPSTMSQPIAGTYSILNYLHEGDNTYLSVTTTGLFRVNSSFVIGANLLTTMLGTKLSANSLDTLVLGSRSQAVKCGIEWFFCNGDFVVASNPALSPAGIGSKAGGYTPACCCLHQSRLVLANFLQTGTRNTEADFIRVWKNMIWRKDTQNIYEGLLPNKSMLIIGPDASGSRSDAFLLELSLLYGYSATALQTAIDNAVRQKQLQAVYLPMLGDILKVISFDNRIIVFGTMGVGMLMQQEDGDYVYRPISPTGISYGNSACSGGGRVVWVDAHGNLNHMFGEFQAHKKFYRNLFAGKTWEVSFDSVVKEFYIAATDSTIGYCYTENDTVYRSRYIPWNVFSRDNSIYGYFAEDSAGESGEVIVFIRDMSQRSIKKVEYIAANFEGDDLYVGTYFRYGVRDSWRSNTKRVNLEGIAYHFAAGTDFKIIAGHNVPTTPDTLDSEITAISVAWKGVDRRPIRGLVIQDGSQGQEGN